MLRQSNLAPFTPTHFNRSRHTCHGDVIQIPPDLLIVIMWSNLTKLWPPSLSFPSQPAILGHPANPVAAYQHLISASPSSSPDHPLLTYHHGAKQVVVIVPLLASALSIMLRALDLDPALYSLHSLRRGGATAAHRQGLHQEMIKHHGMWSSDPFWTYITSLGVASSSMTVGLARAVQATSNHSPPPNLNLTSQTPNYIIQDFVSFTF